MRQYIRNTPVSFFSFSVVRIRIIPVENYVTATKIDEILDENVQQEKRV